MITQVQNKPGRSFCGTNVPFIYISIQWRSFPALAEGRVLLKGSVACKH